MEDEMLLTPVQGNKIPKPLVYIGGTLIVINALILGLYGLAVGAQIFKASVPAGLIMMFTGIGFLVFIPMYTAFNTLAWFGEFKYLENKYEMWLKTIGLFLFSLIGTWVIHALTAFLALLIAGFISGIID